MKLFIIGNGLDLSTGYKTAYLNFKDYLIDNENKYTIGKFSLLDILSNDDYKFWKDFEENLATIALSRLEIGYKGEEGETRENERIICNMQDIYEELYNTIGNAFSDFIEHATKEYRPKNKLFDCEFSNIDKFVSFNYSITLEKIYGIPDKNICYVHGIYLPSRKEEDSVDIVFGHSGEIPDELYAQALYYEESEPEYIKAKIRESLTKQLEIDYFEKFIGNLGNYEEIQIIGHSLGKVDQLYFEKINTYKTPRIIYWEYVDSKEFEESKTKNKVKEIFPIEECSIVFYDGVKILRKINISK